MAGADRLPVAVAVHEGIAASRLLVAPDRRGETAPFVVLRLLDDPGAPGVDVDVGRRPPHHRLLWLVVAFVVTSLEHRAMMVAPSVERHREMLLVRAHELRRVPHPPEKRPAVFPEARHVLPGRP